KGDVDRAIADYDAAIRINPKYAFAYGNRGVAWRSKGDLDRALADLTEAIRLDGGYTGALTHRGMTYESMGQPDKARSDFTAALAAPPKYDWGKWAQDPARARLPLLSPPGTGASSASTSASTSTAIPPAPTGERIALVIGNGAYVHAPKLPN